MLLTITAYDIYSNSAGPEGHTPENARIDQYLLFLSTQTLLLYLHQGIRHPLHQQHTVNTSRTGRKSKRMISTTAVHTCIANCCCERTCTRKADASQGLSLVSHPVAAVTLSSGNAWYVAKAASPNRSEKMRRKRGGVRGTG